MDLTVGKLARAAGVGVETIRFYERRGLLEEPPRTSSGYRRYTPQAVARIDFIRRAQRLGFTLNEIRELIELEEDPNCTCDVVRERALAKIAAVEEKIAQLSAMRGALQEVLQTCDGTRAVRECPLIDCLQDPSLLKC